jgi:phosphoribosylanthranilate isomerase
MEPKIKLKVCGMRDERNILDVGVLAPDFMGFIFYEKSPRFVGNDFIIPKQLKKVERVGVFVNESTDVMLRKAREHTLDYLQLHGHETVEQCAELKENGIKIIKVFSVDDKMDFSLTKPYQHTCDFFLFDTKGKYFGGNAKVFNWEVLDQYDQKIPFFLSGGIGPDNVQNIKQLEKMNLYGVDVNSGVEISPGNKDIGQIRRLKDILDYKK